MIKRGKKFWVGFDLGGTKMMATVYDGAFKAKASAKAKTPVNEGPKAVLARIRETILEALQEAKIPARALAGMKAAFAANATGVWPISGIDETALRPDPALMEKLAAALAAHRWQPLAAG